MLRERQVQQDEYAHAVQGVVRDQLVRVHARQTKLVRQGVAVTGVTRATGRAGLRRSGSHGRIPYLS
jgi:hypothetical protein